LPPDYKERLEPYARRTLGGETPGNLTEEETLRGRESYYANVDFVDDCIGELLVGLEKEGLLENTIVIYTSDHGEMAGSHGLWGKTVYYDESMRVPLLITGPGIEPGHHRTGHTISLMDLYPTTCALAGLPIPESLDGIDMSSVLVDPATASQPRKFAPSAYYTYGVRVKGGAVPVTDDQPYVAWRAVQDSRWKYVEVEGGKPLLFDRFEDPGENTNLAEKPEHAQRCRDMREALFSGFSWEKVHKQLVVDRKRMQEVRSGFKPTTPNQYMLKDGRVFDAEGDLYNARWQYMPPETCSGGGIPQQYG